MYGVWVEPHAHDVIVADMIDAFGQKATLVPMGFVRAFGIAYGKP